jgi:FkbM family methyltransferase
MLKLWFKLAKQHNLVLSSPLYRPQVRKGGGYHIFINKRACIQCILLNIPKIIEVGNYKSTKLVGAEDYELQYRLMQKYKVGVIGCMEYTCPAVGQGVGGNNSVENNNLVKRYSAYVNTFLENVDYDPDLIKTKTTKTGLPSITFKWKNWKGYMVNLMQKDKRTGLYYRKDTLDLYVIREQTQYTKLFELCKNKRVLDIGANIGAFAYNAVEYGASKVYSFEPEPENLELFIAQGIQNTKLYKRAITDRGGTAKFYINTKKNKGLHSLEEKKGRECIVVHTVSLEKVLDKLKNPEVIKIDIEGGEYKLNYDLLLRAKVIAIEIHLQGKDNRQKGRKLLSFLRKNFTELSNSNITDKNWTTVFIGRRKHD